MLLCFLLGLIIIKFPSVILCRTKAFIWSLENVREVPQSFQVYYPKLTLLENCGKGKVQVLSISIRYISNVIFSRIDYQKHVRVGTCLTTSRKITYRYVILLKWLQLQASPQYVFFRADDRLSCNNNNEAKQ